MRKIIFLFLITMVCSHGFGQDKETKEKINKASDRVVFELGLENIIGKPDTLKISALSRGAGVYFMYDLPLGKSHFSFAPGLGISSSNFYHRSQIVSDTAETYFVPIDKNEFDFKKNKISLTYVDIPLEFRFRSKPNEKGTSWKLATGFKLGFLLQNKWKYKGPELNGSGETVKFKEFNIKYLQKLRYGVSIRGGYGMFNLFAFYNISSLFKQDAGPQLHPITFGIAINGL
jgi:hypothetical protein